MLIRLSNNLRLRISKPISLYVAPKPQLELKLQNMQPIEIPELPDGYTLRLYKPGDESQIVSLLNSSEISFNVDQLINALSICLPNGCYLIEHISTKSIVATMMARHLATENYPFGGRIDWLATDPSHRKLGLGTICASAATKRLLDGGYENIWVNTDHRIGTFKVYYRIGFRPVVYQSMEIYWRQLYDDLGLDISELDNYVI